MKILLKIAIILLFFISDALGAEWPPQPPKLPTFGQIITQEAERLEKEKRDRPIEYIRKFNPASLEGLPADLQRSILLILSKSGPYLNISALAEGIIALAGTSRALHKSLNTPENILAIFNALPYTANAITLFGLLQKKIGLLPVMKNKNVTDWLNSAYKQLRNGDTLYNAANSGDLEMIRSLFTDKFINLNWHNFEGITPLIISIENNRINIVTLLLTVGANPNCVDNVKRTPLFYASLMGYSEIVKILLSNNANVDIADNYGVTSLMAAALKGHTEIVRMLIDHEAQVNVEDRSGETALMIAATRGHIEIVKLLLAANADPTICNWDRKTAKRMVFQYHSSNENNKPMIAKLLEEAEEKWEKKK